MSINPPIIVIVIGSFGNPVYQELFGLRKQLLDAAGIDYRFVFDDDVPDRYYLGERDIIVPKCTPPYPITNAINSKEGAWVPHMTRKFVAALKSLDLTSYDYIVRVNASTFLHMEKLLGFLRGANRTNYVAGHVMRHVIPDFAQNPVQPTTFLSGTCMIFSRDVATMFRELSLEDPLFFEHNDDVVLSWIVQKQGIPFVDCPWVLLEGDEMVRPEQVEKYWLFRVKHHSDRRKDVVNWRHLIELSGSKRFAAKTASMLHRTCLSDFNREPILSWIRQQKKQKQKPFTVIDVGGSITSWSHSVVDAICDINPPVSDTPIRVFRMNLSKEEDWAEVDAYVAKNGKFDFSICSHTLEDISNPSLVCRKLSEISKEGWIAVPSKYKELARFENSEFKYRGYIHHRWIFSIQGGKFVGWPKIPYLEQDPFYDTIADVRTETQEMSFFWRGALELKIINNDFLGPGDKAVISYYRTLAGDDIDVLKAAQKRSKQMYAEKHMGGAHLEHMRKLKAGGFEPKVIYDIGACVTEWACMAKSTWPNAIVYCFDAYDPLECVLRGAGFPHYMAVLGDEDGKEVKFYQHTTWITGNSYYREIGSPGNFFSPTSYVSKTMIRLDTLREEYSIPLPDFVKIDVQGAEKDVLEGGWATIQNAKHMVIEMQHMEYNEGAPKVDETLPWIEAHGWKCTEPLFHTTGFDGDYGFTRLG
jgi:FkbM family methyltransferase